MTVSVIEGAGGPLPGERYPRQPSSPSAGFNDCRWFSLGLSIATHWSWVMKRTVTALVGTFAVLAIAVPALANAASSRANHCILNIDTGKETCSSKITPIKNGRLVGVKDSDGIRLTAVGDGNGEVVQARFFDDQNFGGASLTATGASPCKDGDGQNFALADLGKLGWANRISSVQSWANCWLYLYSGPNGSGDKDGPYKVDTPYVGPALDNRTQSVAFD